MKKIILLSTLILCSQSVTFAKDTGLISKKSQTQICKSLYAQAEDECTQSMCEQYLSDSGETECHKDGDFYEGLQICAGDDVFPNLILDFNKSHQDANLNCDDVDYWSK